MVMGETIDLAPVEFLIRRMRTEYVPANFGSVTTCAHLSAVGAPTTSFANGNTIPRSPAVDKNSRLFIFRPLTLRDN
jgi:hypothetical protein